ncbi:LamG-like jellyroll fold domain-containing protein [Azohydromonas caseinilytica]|uniref:PEP-CTERM sorting domain-containing protein n=1 Tax=Azohydromonas caseinilytica TaxID=2728836 RepID=A0A848FB82_9BURK|nr:LamG-like jellyroll fold domain-containing protein [Azohydromonas caseinilytica]NML16136.1 PEP-CTERM sorting domain-containing protein [Azohydromonas caseinilytica]
MKKLLTLAATASTTAALLGAPTAAQAGLIGLYQFNDAAQLGLDTSGAGRDGTVSSSGADYSAAGYQGGAASFSGGSVSVNLDVNASVLPKMSWGAWVKPTSTRGYQTILSADNGGYDREITIDARGSGFNSWSAFTGTGVLSSYVTPSTTDWTFVAAVYDQVARLVTLYVDGVMTMTSTNFSPSFNFFQIGHNPGHGEAFTGLIDNVFVYDQALTSTEIAAIRANGFPAPVPEPASLALVGLGGVLALGVSRRQRRPQAASLK